MESRRSDSGSTDCTRRRVTDGRRINESRLYEQFRQPPAVHRGGRPDADGGKAWSSRWRRSGLCRSDWHGWMGHDPDIRLPHVPGHELAGTVEAVGSQVTRWRTGDRVTVPFVAGCGHCHECTSGNHQVCEHQFQPGFTAWGSFAEYVAIDFADINLVRLPDELDFATAASLGCRFVTSFRGDRRPGPRPAGRMGGGAWLRRRRPFGDHDRQRHGRQCDRDRPCRGQAGFCARDRRGRHDQRSRDAADVVGAVREITRGGAHVSMDALGHPTTCFNSIANLRRRGRHVQVGLMLGEHARPQIPMDKVIANELRDLRQPRHAGVPLRGDAGHDPRSASSRRKGSSATDQPRRGAGGADAMDRFEGIGISVITRF